jgi:hypothetical protein
VARIDAMAVVADEGLAMDDPLAGLVHFLERGLEMQSADRGLKEVLHGIHAGAHRVAHAREQMAPRVMTLVARAQESGDLRADMSGTDIRLIVLMIGSVMDATQDFRPDVWRRLLTFVVDGLRAKPAVASELSVPPMSIEDVQRVMVGPRPRR